MPIEVKANISKPSNKTVKVSAVDSESLIKALDKLGSWGKYSVKPTVTAKVGKDKKVTEVTIKAAPVATVPVWSEYSKSTKSRQAEWDKMIPLLKKYLTNQHALFLEAVAIFSKEAKSLDLDKPGFDKLWKTKLAKIKKIHDDYAQKTSNGQSIGAKLAIIGPDPVDGQTNFKAPKTITYKVSGKTIEAVFKALNKRKFWGRYRSHQACDLDFAIDGKLSKIVVKAAPVITMPKWAEYAKGNKDQKATWDKMWGILNTHENNHHKIFTDEVAAFLKDIKDMDMDKSAATKHWTAKNKEWQDKQDAYDSSSGHGVNEGVSLDFNADP